MSEELTDLQAKYIEGVETMSEADARRYFRLLEEVHSAEFRERRLSRLKTRLEAIDRQSRVEQRKRDEHTSLLKARDEFNVITRKWEAQGAVRHDLHEGHVEAWSYEGAELYRWGGGYRPTMHEMLADVQRIDAELTFS